MQFKSLFAEERAVSPVIGVILMVAITVILAAVIGTFVLGLGDQLSATSPQASFSFDQDGSADNNGTVTVIHDGGDKIAADELKVLIGGDNVEGNINDDFGTDVSAGSSMEVDLTNYNSGEELRVVWESPDGGDSSTLGTYELN